MVEQVFFVSTQMNKLRTQNDFVDPVMMFKSKPCQFVFPVPPQRGRGLLRPSCPPRRPQTPSLHALWHRHRSHLHWMRENVLREIEVGARAEFLSQL